MTTERSIVLAIELKVEMRNNHTNVVIEDSHVPGLCRCVKYKQTDFGY